MRSTISRPRYLAILSLSGLALIAAACSSSGGAATAAPSAAAPSAAAPSAAAPAGDLTLNVATGAPGSFVTGKDGLTLYVFTPDSAGKSTCVDACAAAWPPLVVAAGSTPKAGTGVTGALTTFARADGSMQVALNGMPLYYYAADKKAGDTTGQGVGGKWFVASPTGAAPSVAPSSGASRQVRLLADPGSGGPGRRTALAIARAVRCQVGRLSRRGSARPSSRGCPRASRPWRTGCRRGACRTAPS